MPDHVKINERLTGKEAQGSISATFLGQAHIAGTGPVGKTCRECAFWHVWKKEKAEGGIVDAPHSPGYFSYKHETKAFEIKKAKCNRPILNKANRLIPHAALACRLFEENKNPPAINIKND